MCPIECSPGRLQHILHTPNTETCTTRRLVRVLFFFPRPAPLFSLYLSSLISRAGGGRWSARRHHEQDETRSQTTTLRGERTASRKIGFVRLRRAVVQRARGDDAAKGEWSAVMEVIMRRRFLSGSDWHIIHTRWGKAGEGGGSAHY